MEDDTGLLSDPKYKQYAAAIDKALKNFEYSSEWADLISCLGKLNKTIQSYPKYHAIPKKLFVGKRLAQCLHPALPSGVHLKALETYDLIFKQIGHKRLAEDLFVFSAGIFPLLGQAAISVKPVLFDLYENHFLPLGKKLLPGLPGLVLALLPGIEEASEHTGRTTQLLEAFCFQTEEESFFSALWYSVLYSPPVRLSALTFAVGHVGNLAAGNRNEKLYIFGNDLGLMVKSVCGALDDSNVLVQRMTLEFLTLFIPVHTKYLSAHQLMTILMFALSVVLRRDMSLNRRLFQWLLGLNSNGTHLQRAGSVNSVEGHVEEESVETLDYFQQYSKDLVVSALISLFQTSKIDRTSTSVSEKGSNGSNRKKHDELKPFRILISLLDKPEIGSVILEDVLLEVFRTLYQNCVVSTLESPSPAKPYLKKWKPQKGIHDELVKTANLLFNAFEPYFMWDFLRKTLVKCKPAMQGDDSNAMTEEAPSSNYVWSDLVHTATPTYAELFGLIDFLLDVVSLEASLETQSEHWPDLLNQLILELADHLELIKLENVKQGTQLGSKLLSKISPPFRQFGRSDTMNSDPQKPNERTGSKYWESETDSLPGSPCSEAYEETGRSWSTMNSPVHIPKESMPLMKKCIQNTKLLFLKFVDGRVIPVLAHDANTSCSARCISCESRYYKRIVNTSFNSYDHLSPSGSTLTGTKKCDDVHGMVHAQLGEKFEENGDLCCLTFVALCNFLVELSCFPFLLDVSYSSDQMVSEELKNDEWIESLLVCCCQEDGFNFQSAAISTLLDLVNVSMTLLPNMCSDSQHSTSPKAMPLISWSCMQMLEHSHLYEKLASSLWARISSDNSHLNRTCVELFLQLHNLTPSSVTCEDVISKTLVHPEMLAREKAFWRFGVLWHLSRDYYKNADNSRSSRGPARTFDRCLLLMLDGLNSECPKIRFHVLEWLKHAIHYGDIGRILEPLLLVLLDPSSSRVGVHHVNKVIKRNEANVGKRKCFLEENSTDKLVNRQDLAGFDSDKEDDNTTSHSLDATLESVVSDSSGSLPLNIPTKNSTTEVKNGQEAESGFADDEEEEEERNPKRTPKRLEKKDREPGEENNAKLKKEMVEPRKVYHTELHPLLTHKLYYLQHLDTQQTLQALDILLGILRSDGRAFVCSALTASMSICCTPHQSSLRELLIRHRKAITGGQFFGSLSDSHQLLVRASTAKYLEILLTVCLYFVRSDYHTSVPTSDWDVQQNLRVQILSAELLTMIVKTMRKIATDSGAGFADFVCDILIRCKVQRMVLHCLLSTVYTLSEDTDSETSWSPRGISSSVESTKGDLSMELKTFTHKSPTHSVCNQSEESEQKVNLQKALLCLAEEIIFLEDTVWSTESKAVDFKSKEKFPKKKVQAGGSSVFEYLPSHSLAIQPMFLSVLLSTLKEQEWLSLHHRWIFLVINSLPRLNEALPKIVVPVVDQICLNLKVVSELYSSPVDQKKVLRRTLVPPDYLLTLLEDMTAICHFCLIDVSALQPLISMAPKANATLQPRKRGTEDDANTNTNSLQIFSNLIHVFSVQAAPVKKTNAEEVYQPVVEAREGLLSILPAIVTSLVTVWLSWNPANEQQPRGTLILASERTLPIGSPKPARQSVLQFLTPIAMNHTIVFLASTADVWNQAKPKDPGQCKQSGMKKGKEWLAATNRKVLPKLSEEQDALIEIISSIKVLTLENIVETIRQVLRQMLTNKEKQRVTHALEVNLLQFLYEVLQKRTIEEIGQVKTSLMSLIKDGIQLNLPAPALFVFLSIFSKFINRVAVPEDRRARRELQDIAQKLVDGCNAIAAASLESSAWFRRSLTVVPQADQSVDMDESSQSDRLSISETTQSTAINTKNAQYSVQALCILAEILSPMLDLLYTSEEKDRVASIMVNVMYNIVPYLKNHSPSNASGFRACSAFLAGISDYQYTLRAWKKEVYELFLDTDFFTLDPMCVAFWRAVIDRLMTYDSTLFKDLMTKIAMAQSGAINIFANREQEMEQRAQLLKRLSFTIFCGEKDQYHSSLPDIQERLAESLRHILVPVLHEQVFLCFRVLLLRMSPHHLVSLWPHIITEMVVVFLHMEQDLLSNGKEGGSKAVRLGPVESFFGLNGVPSKNEKWLALYLAACKMLDFALSLPSDIIPQFQVFKWAFIDTPGIAMQDLSTINLGNAVADTDRGLKKGKKVNKKRSGREDPPKSSISKMTALNSPLTSRAAKAKASATKEQVKGDVNDSKTENNLTQSFIPYLSKLTALLLRRHKEESLACLTRKPGQPVITISRIKSVEELLPFLLSVTGKRASSHIEIHAIKQPKLDHFEALVERDFIAATNSS